MLLKLYKQKHIIIQQRIYIITFLCVLIVSVRNVQRTDMHQNPLDSVACMCILCFLSIRLLYSRSA